MEQVNIKCNEVTDYPLVSSACLVNFCDVIADYGVDGELLLRRHQLHPQFIRLPNAQVRYDRIISLLNDAVDVSNCPHLGLLLGSRMPVDSIDLVLLSSHFDTFGEAISSVTQYQRLFGKGFTLELSTGGDTSTLKYFHDNCAADDLRALSDLAATAMLSILRFFLGDRLKVNVMTVDIPEPEDASFYAKLANGQCEFSGDCISITFPSSLLSLPLQGNKRMRDIMLQHVEDQMKTSRQDLVSQVSHLVNVLLPTGRCCIENVADVLGVHRRTLQKKLNALDITFKDILRSKREEKAIYLLAKTDLGVQDIAVSLGYSETANFLHAFKRWIGQSPASWRKAHLQGLISDAA